MENQIVLSKESSESEIKCYFNAVLELSKSDNEFPINLDEVWMLVYPRKDHAVRALEENFIQDVDYQVFLKNGENPCGGRPSNIYKLSVSCLEFFIARKVRPVFEVYRKVFHGVAHQVHQVEQEQPKPLPLKDKLMWVKEVSKMLKLNDTSTLGLLQQIASPLGLPTPEYAASKGVLKPATRLLADNGSSLSIIEFNSKMIEKGLLETLSRNSSKGLIKKFKNITKKGLEWGENLVNPKSPQQTQPLYYADKFPELLKLLA